MFQIYNIEDPCAMWYSHLLLVEISWPDKWFIYVATKFEHPIFVLRANGKTNCTTAMAKSESGNSTIKRLAEDMNGTGNMLLCVTE